MKLSRICLEAVIADQHTGERVAYPALHMQMQQIKASSKGLKLGSLQHADGPHLYSITWPGGAQISCQTATHAAFIAPAEIEALHAKATGAINLDAPHDPLEISERE